MSGAAEFEAQVHAFEVKLDHKLRRVVNGCAIELQRSVVEGSEITGAPGQPVDTGFLWSSWIGHFTDPWRWLLTTPASYARVIEENMREAFDPKGVDRPKEMVSQGGTNRKGPSTRGGHHSVKLTRGGWQKIVDAVARRVRAS